MLTEKWQKMQRFLLATAHLGQLGFASKETQEQKCLIGVSLKRDAGHTHLGG